MTLDYHLFYYQAYRIPATLNKCHTSMFIYFIREYIYYVFQLRIMIGDRYTYIVLLIKVRI